MSQPFTLLEKLQIESDLRKDGRLTITKLPKDWHVETISKYCHIVIDPNGEQQGGLFTFKTAAEKFMETLKTNS